MEHIIETLECKGPEGSQLATLMLSMQQLRRCKSQEISVTSASLGSGCRRRGSTRSSYGVDRADHPAGGCRQVRRRPVYGGDGLPDREAASVGCARGSGAGTVWATAEWAAPRVRKGRDPAVAATLSTVLQFARRPASGIEVGRPSNRTDRATHVGRADFGPVGGAEHQPMRCRTRVRSRPTMHVTR
jgi:hypothetical protein